MRPKVSVGTNNKKVNVLDFGLTPLLKEHDANNVGNGEEVPQELQQKRKVGSEGSEVLLLEGVPKPSHLGGGRIEVG